MKNEPISLSGTRLKSLMRKLFSFASNYRVIVNGIVTYYVPLAGNMSSNNVI